MTEACFSFWIGERLGTLERACLLSVARHHPTALYCYDPPLAVPDGIEVRDAATIVPRDLAERHAAVPAILSDLFRYEALRQGCGTWVDCDVYLLASLDLHKPCLFGWESPGRINNAVLRLPKDSAVLDGLLAPFTDGRLPAGLRLTARLRARRPYDLRALPWGSTGPLALTALVKRHNLLASAEPQERFYPVHWRDAEWIRDPAIALEQVVSEQTVAIHLWNQCIDSFKDAPAPAGSFLARLQREGAV